VSDRIVINEFSDQVKENLDEVGLETRKIEPGETIRSQARNLVPGQGREFIIEIPKNVDRVQIDLTNVAPELSPAQQNPFFGDDVIFSVHQAKPSAFGDYPIFDFFNGPASFTIDNPEPGFMRITFTGDWTNAGRVSAEFAMRATLKPTPTFRRDGTIADGQTL